MPDDMTLNPNRVDVFFDIGKELKRADKWGGFTSAHQAFAHIHEEFDELKDHVWTRQKDRDLDAMYAEAIQVAAMGAKFAEMIKAGHGRV